MKQRLPQSESAYLNSLSHSQGLTRDRVRDLCKIGWSFAAIAEAFDPPKSRSSIRSWSLSTQPPLTHNHPLLPSPSSSSSIAAAESSTFAKPKRERRVYIPSSPALTSAEKERIKAVAPLARRYRARANPTGVYASANQELTQISRGAYSRGVSITELATAAGVTYRAMARRLGK